MNKAAADDFTLTTVEIPEPAAAGPVSSGKVIHGRLIPPQQQILLFSADDWELFVEEWVHYQRPQYKKVTRLSGACDMGIDVAGFADDDGFKGVWDNFQCKHYGDPLTPQTAIKEIGKCLWHAFEGRFRSPRKYYFMAPKDCGMSLKKLLLDSSGLRAAVAEKWDKWCSSSITATQEIVLEGDFKHFVDAYNFTIFTFKPTLDVLAEHRKTPYHAPRFGGGLPERGLAGAPPAEPAGEESRYLRQLMDAYGDHKKQPIADCVGLSAWPELDQHYHRQREAFYHAESLRNFARDNVPAGTFEDLQDEIFDGVVEVQSAAHADGLARLNAVTQAAVYLHPASNGLISVTKVKDKKGICHQLANEDRLQWVK